ncbi:MAG: hypothetical protein ACOZNI_03600 [Myxococcota bacterium]
MVALLLVLVAHAADAVSLRARNPEAERVLGAALQDPAFWADAARTTYDGKVYDEIRLKPQPRGYVTYISGEGDADFTPSIVADVVFRHMDRVPRYSPGAKVVLQLGSGVDPEIGAPYVDTFYYLDLDALYVTYTQRMYRAEAGDGRTVLWYEALAPEVLDAATRAAYAEKIARAEAGVDRRLLFSSVVPVDDIYGMYVVEPGTSRSARVTFVTKFVLGEDAGWIGQLGSELPPVLRAGLKSGFSSCVEIARAEQARLVGR